MVDRVISRVSRSLASARMLVAALLVFPPKPLFWVRSRERRICAGGSCERERKRERRLGRTVQLAAATARHAKVPQCQSTAPSQRASTLPSQGCCSTEGTSLQEGEQVLRSGGYRRERCSLGTVMTIVCLVSCVSFVVCETKTSVPCCVLILSVLRPAVGRRARCWVPRSWGYAL